LAERSSRVVGALACPPDIPGVAWVRLIALADDVEAGRTWEVLWALARQELAATPGCSVAGLSLEPWTRPLYESAGFQHTHDVVVLHRSLTAPVSVPTKTNGRRPPVTVRVAETHDHAAILQTDTAAFVSPWGTELEFVIMVIAVSCVKLLSAHNSTQHTSRKHKV
jgi:hypothetical protein